MKKIFLITLIVLFFIGCKQASTEDLQEVSNTRSANVLTTVAGNTTLCLIGDSRVAGIPSDLFSDNWTVVNYGVGGTTSYYSACVARILPKTYDAIIISVGINDYYNGIELEDSIKDITVCCQYAKLHSQHVYLTTIPGIALSSCFTLDQANHLRCFAWQLNIYLNVIAQNCGVTLIPLAETLNDGIYLRSDYADSSGIHYNTAGYQALHDLYVSYIGL